MKTRTKRLALFSVSVAATGLIACGPKDKGGEEIDHATARQAITGNSRDVSADLTRSIEFLDRSELFNMGVDRGFASGGDDTLCAAPTDGSTGDTTCTDQETTTDVQVDLDLNDDTDALLQELEKRILADENVESESGSSVTYLLRGDVLCDDGTGTVDQECAQTVDDAEIRIVVSSPSPGNVDVDVQVGPDRANPLFVQFHQDLLAVEVDLGGIKASADHLEAVSGEPMDLPSTFQGRVRFQLKAHSDTKIGGVFSILNAVKVADGEWSFAAAQADPAYSVTVDGQAETVELVSSFGAIDGLFPTTDYEYDPETDTETETTYDIGFHVAASSMNALFDAANEVLTLTDVGYQGTSTVSIDGDQVLAVDLNEGDTFDATITSAGNDAVDVEVDPKFDLRVALQFASATDVLSDIEDWMLDDVLSVTLDGATKPALRFHADTDAVEVLDGTLELSLQNEGTTLTATAGQCVVDTYSATTGDGSMTEPSPTEPVEEPWTPLSDLAVETCQ